MTDVMKRQEEERPARQEERPARLDVFDRFDRMFGDWMSSLPFRRALEQWEVGREQMIRVDEFDEEGQHVVRAELPGIDPEKDVEVTIANGALRISAERRQEERTEERGYVRSEMRYGKFTRTIALPEGVTEEDVRASYKDGILEIRLPVSSPRPATKVAIAKG